LFIGQILACDHHFEGPIPLFGIGSVGILKS